VTTATARQETTPLTVARIDLNAFAGNIKHLLRFIGSDVRLMAVVKADAYGHGAAALGKVAQDAGASHLAVYTLAEAVALRNADIDGPVVVLGPILPTDAPVVVARSITPCIATLPLAQSLSSASQSRGTTVPYHLEIDTGLTRYGIMPNEVEEFCLALERLPGLEREGLFTHFASADEEPVDTTRTQFSIFRDVADRLAAIGMTFPIHHVCASAAALNFPEMHLDMVRCGICLYGYYPTTQVVHTVEVHPVMTLTSQIARVRTVPVGTGVSYGHEWTADRPSTIGLVPIGYADGLPRQVQGNGKFLVRGFRAPILGRIAMDQIMIDLTDIPDAAPGDEVVILGQSGADYIWADEIGAWAGTISYDILSGISARVPRVYAPGGNCAGGPRARSGSSKDR
jgi:alanine racemase